MNIAILGCGPSGLLSAWAATQAGHRVKIYSIKQKALMPGAIYVHDPIPGLESAGPTCVKTIRYIKLGTRQGYARKVYGDPNAPCSWDKFLEGDHAGCAVGPMYDELWGMFDHLIEHRSIGPQDVPPIQDEADIVISTIPLPVICMDEEHAFLQKRIWVRNLAHGITAQYGDNCIVYNGDQNVGYYRASLIAGEGSTEFGYQVHNAQEGRKPLSTDCTCHPGVVRAGRYGKWERGVLVHHAYRQVRELLS